VFGRGARTYNYPVKVSFRNLIFDQGLSLSRTEILIIEDRDPFCLKGFLKKINIDMFRNVPTAMADKYSGFIQGRVHYTKSVGDLYLRLAKKERTITQKG